MKRIPTDIRLHTKSRLLEVVFDDETFKLPCEYLRVYSPSAEVKGHGPGQEVLQTNKEDVNIVAVEPVGNYAVRLIYSCLLYTSPSPRDQRGSRMPSSA